MIRVENLTSYPTGEVERLVRWTCAQNDLDELYGQSLLVRLKHHGGSHCYQGRFYPFPHRSGVIQVPFGVSRLIIGRVAHPGACAYPTRHDRGLRGGPPPSDVHSWQEAVVGIVAHEGRHAWEWVNRYARKKAGRPRHSEVECEWAEHRILNRYREEFA